MGKHLRVKRLDDEPNNKQPGCIWGLVHVLYYHNVKKMIHPRKYDGPTHDNCDWSPERSMNHHDASEAEKLLDENQSLNLSTRRSRATKKRSLRARIKALISEEISKEDKNTREKGGFSFKPNLQRTYSIHHLESLDDGLNKISRGCKNQIIFLPKDADNGSSQSFDTNQENSPVNVEANRGESIMQSSEHLGKLDSKEDPDVFDIFKVDKAFLLKNLQDSDEGLAGFSRSALGLNTQAKFSKSRSFPVAEWARKRKLKPIKLESKQKEVWSFPKENKLQIADQAQSSESIEEDANREVKNGLDRIGDKNEEDGFRKRTHRRSFSLNESLDKYNRLFENSFGKDAKLNSSKSLKLSNEYGLAPLYFRRIHSLSYVDSLYLNLNLEVSTVDNTAGNGLIVIEKYSSSCRQDSEHENVVSLPKSDAENRPLNAKMQLENDHESLRKVNGVEEEADKLNKNDFLLEQGLVLDSEIFLQETDQGQISKASNLENDESSESIINLERDKCPKKKISDLDYVRHLLHQSGIAVDASEMTWHSSDQPLGPQLFEQVEAHWPHEQDELTGWPDFYGCWHHQMLFDLVNEVLVEVYDVSLPYYPKALSSSCHVRPFPVGNRIIEDVCTTIGALLDVKPDKKQSLGCIVARDLADHSWMSLQLESEFIGLHLEDMIFSELLEEVF